MDPKPRFEVLDTKDIESGWSALTAPRLHVSLQKYAYSIEACAAAYVDSGPAVFISVGDAGTYLYDVDKKLWHYVGDFMLPFCGLAVARPPSLDLPCAPSLCFAYSLLSEKFSAFCFHYYENDLRVDEIDIDNSPLHLLPPLTPELYREWSLTAFDAMGRVYFITSGIDYAEESNAYDGSRHLKVEVFNLKLNEGQLGESCDNNKRRKIGHGEKEGETVVLCLNKGMSFKMTPVWRRSLLGGPVSDISEPVSAAFAI